MCGIAGAVVLGCHQDDWTDHLERMASVIRHRGPDDHGYWSDPKAGVGLAQRRLSILDLSPAGHQPMISDSGRYVITYNGEVYNFEELRAELDEPGRRWRGHSDTEVILAAIERWGLESSVQRFVGMFAFALWDRHDSNLYLVRDRVGIKPLYYGWGDQSFLFGSEIKALRAHPSANYSVDPDALALLMRHNYITAPYSIYRGISKLEAGHILKVPVRGELQPRELVSTPYWSWRDVAQRGQCDPFRGTEAEGLDELNRLLRQAVKQRMIADVPLGAFLSGGVDSSAVVAMMQAQSDRPVKTFTIGFNEEEFNEAVYAKQIAERLGTDHTELYVSAKDALDVIPKLPTMYDEPFSDSSQVPTFLVSELARRHVTVTLSGDGGDELFGGYRRYAMTRAMWQRMSRMPGWSRRAASALLTAAPKRLLDVGFSWCGPIFEKYGRPGSAGDKFKKLAEVLATPTPELLYREVLSHWKDPNSVVDQANEPDTLLTSPEHWPVLPDLTHRLMFLDSLTYLPDGILVKVDRASMAVSLETRVPILDHRVVELAWRLPLASKVRNGTSKWALRQVLSRYLPPEMTDRPKLGFSVPIDSWLRGPLREWAEDLLAEQRLRQEGVFHPKPIRLKWDEHQSGDRNWHFYLWDVLMFQAWFAAQAN